MAAKAKRAVRWEPWKNPLRTLGHFERDEDGQVVLQDNVFQGPAALTRMGIVPVNEDNDPAKVFSLWTGHTNFTIDEPTARLIAAEDGVEALDVLTRYRFRIAVGKAYQPEAVRKGVERTILDPAAERVRPILNLLYGVPDFWAYVILPRGGSHFYRAATRDQAQRWLDLWGDRPARSYVSWSIATDA